MHWVPHSTTDPRDGANDLNDEEEENSADNDRCKRKLYQCALGLFHTIIVTENAVTCTCENFRRFGRYEDSKLMIFICLGELGQPTEHDNHAVDFSDIKEGYPVISKRLREKVLKLVEHGKTTVDAPAQDPSSFLQDPE